MPFQLATADISSDMKAGKNIETVAANAVASGMSIENMAIKMVTDYPKSTLLIISAATKASPSKAIEIIAAVTEIMPNLENQIATWAIAAGANPTVVSGMSIEDLAIKLVSDYPKSTLLIISAAIKASPDKAKEIVAAVTEIMPNLKNQIVTWAIAAGANPTDVTSATAAGATASGFSVSSALASSGDGGGGSVSPN